MLKDDEVGEIWLDHCQCSEECGEAALIRKLVAERFELRNAEFLLDHSGDCCWGTKHESLKGECVKRDWSDAQWTAEVLKEFGIPEETWAAQ